jgi:hypothetical protein
MDVAQIEYDKRDHQDQIASADIDYPVCKKRCLDRFTLAELELRKVADRSKHERN